MFELRKSFSFEASHVLKHHDGKCANMHGHSYKMTVELRGETLQSRGSKRNMVMDFSDISRYVKKLIQAHLDHRHLNDSLHIDSPTAEFIAFWCFQRLKPDLPLLTAVEIRETTTAAAIYRPTPLASAVRSGLEKVEHDASTCAHCRCCPYRTRAPSSSSAAAHVNGTARHGKNGNDCTSVESDAAEEESC